MAIQTREVSRLLVLSAGRWQGKYLSLADPMFDAMRNPLQKNENLSQTRDFLLPKLFSGELNVSVLDIEIKEFAA